VIRALYDAFARGDIAAVLGAFAPDIVWNEAEGFVYADRNPYVGPQAVLEGVFMRLGTEWDGFNAMPEEIIGSGDSVIARGRYRGTFKTTGVAVNAQFVHAWKLRDGKVAGFQQYTDTAQFRDAVAKAAGA
jgi:uncharacterized protein